MLLEMKNVVKQFGGLTAVSNMSFSVEKGEIFGVIGPNGAGKTTIFNLITGVYQVTEGDILFDGQSIEGKNPIRSSTWVFPVPSRTSAFFRHDCTGKHSGRSS